MSTEKQEAIAQRAERAISLCREGKWREGREHLAELSDLAPNPVSLPAEYFAYLGYCVARFDRRIKEGIRLCEHAVTLDPGSPEAYLNLARTHMLDRNRWEASKALIRGERLDPNNELLRELHYEVGIRRSPILPFLARGNRINVALGRWRHHLSPPAADPLHDLDAIE